MRIVLYYTLALLLLLFFASNVHANNAYVHAMAQRGSIVCLSSALFSEGQLESKQDREKIAVVILNRAIAKNKHVCDILREKAQFSFYKAGYSFTKNAMYEENIQIVLDILGRAMHNRQSNYGNITFFHARNVRPAWASKMKRMYVESGHVFYKEMEK